MDGEPGGMINETEKDERELLAELIELQKKAAKRQLAAAIASGIVAVVMVIALLIVVPRLMELSREISSMVENTQKLVEEADTLIGQATESLDGIDTMIGNVNQVVVDNTQAATDALNNVQNIDIDKLNEAIRNLSDAVEPLAKLNNGVSNLFNR